MMPFCHPDCTRDPTECRVTATVPPPQLWRPIFDGKGRVTNPSATVTDYSCDTCSMSWRRVATGDETVVEDTTGTTLPARA
jgi:hypothetical protein